MEEEKAALSGSSGSYSPLSWERIIGRRPTRVGAVAVMAQADFEEKQEHWSKIGIAAGSSEDQTYPPRWSSTPLPSFSPIPGGYSLISSLSGAAGRRQRIATLRRCPVGSFLPPPPISGRSDIVECRQRIAMPRRCHLMHPPPPT